MTKLSMTYAFEISMDHSLTVNVDQSLADTSQLEGYVVVNELMTTRLRIEHLQVRTDLRPDVPLRSR